MAYPNNRDHYGEGHYPLSDVMAAFLQRYPRATKGSRSKSQRSRSRRRKSQKKSRS